MLSGKLMVRILQVRIIDFGITYWKEKKRPLILFINISIGVPFLIILKILEIAEILL